MFKKAALNLVFFFWVASWPVLARPVEEIRALWVKFDELTTPEKIDEVVENAQTTRINLIFPQTRRLGVLLYPSEVEKTSSLVKKNFDPLDYLISRAHQAKIEVHPWINTFYVWSNPKNAPSDHISQNKNWLITQGKNSSKQIFLNPANPQVQAYLFNLIKELAAHYPIDGLHLDYIRYPQDAEDGYQDFADQNGPQPWPKNKESWTEWRADQVTRFVEKVYQIVSEINPQIKLSAAVIPEVREAAYYKGQNWPKWLNDGLVDFVVLMSYSHDWSKIQKQVTQATAATNNKRFVVAGLGVWRQTLSEISQNISALRKLMANEKYSALKGFALFSYDHLKDKPNFLKVLREKVFSFEAEQPKMPWKKQKLSAQKSEKIFLAYGSF